MILALFATSIASLSLIEPPGCTIIFTPELTKVFIPSVNGKNEIKREQVIDSLEIARGKYPGSSNSLDALCKRFGIDLSRRTKHNALLDCELLREVYINLLDAKEPKLVFSNDKIENSKDKYQDSSVIYCKKIIKPSSEEFVKHKEFLKKELKKNYY